MHNDQTSHCAIQSRQTEQEALHEVLMAETMIIANAQLHAQ
jgi:hypothetical protein